MKIIAIPIEGGIMVKACTDIEEASRQQSSAIAEVDTGLTQIYQVVQSNVAMAEESAASSQELMHKQRF